MSYQQARIADARNNVIKIEHPDVPEYPISTLSAPYTAGGLTLTVADNEGFSAAAAIDELLVGELGQSTTEITSINAPFVPGTSLNIAALTFDHPVDTPLKFILWNKVEISGSATITGAKTVIATVDLEVQFPATIYAVTGTTYAYYFARYYNSTSTTYGSYSDAAPAAGYDSTTVRAVKKTALALTGEKIGSVITDDFLNTEVVNCEIDIWKEKRRWAHFEVDRLVLGTLTAGAVNFTLPSDISDPDTNEAIRSVRVRQIGQLRYIDEESVEGLLWDTAVTTLAVTANAGDTTITLTSVADFQDTGSVLLGTDTVTYTARNTTTNVLSGIPASGTGSITVSHAATTTNVWQGGNVENSPSVYTVIPGILSIVLPPSASYQGQALYLSYYSKPSYPLTDAASVSWPDPELYHFWLAWKIDLRRHDGTPTPAGLGFKAQYDERKQTLLSRARLQDNPKMIPRRPFGRQELSMPSDSELVSWLIR